eukprot:3932530-Rhodomonas_salina.1
MAMLLRALFALRTGYDATRILLVTLRLTLRYASTEPYAMLLLTLRYAAKCGTGPRLRCYAYFYAATDPTLCCYQAPTFRFAPQLSPVPSYAMILRAPTRMILRYCSSLRYPPTLCSYAMVLPYCGTKVRVVIRELWYSGSVWWYANCGTKGPYGATRGPARGSQGLRRRL